MPCPSHPAATNFICKGVEQEQRVASVLQASPCTSCVPQPSFPVFGKGVFPSLAQPKPGPGPEQGLTRRQAGSTGCWSRSNP